MQPSRQGKAAFLLMGWIFRLFNLSAVAKMAKPGIKSVVSFRHRIAARGMQRSYENLPGL
jgi:hypothetical protein